MEVRRQRNKFSPDGNPIYDINAGLLIGVFAVFVKKVPAVVVFGLVVGLLLAYLVASMSPDPNTGQHYYVQIMVPGALIGISH